MIELPVGRALTMRNVDGTLIIVVTGSGENVSIVGNVFWKMEDGTIVMWDVVPEGVRYGQ